MCFNSSAERLVSGGLDCQLKIYDVSTCQVVHSLKYPAPVLSVAIAVSLFACCCFRSFLLCRVCAGCSLSFFSPSYSRFNWGTCFFEQASKAHARTHLCSRTTRS
jgi:WD40 repeat protein